MKFLCIFLIPAVFAAVPHKRVLFTSFLNSQEATKVIDQLVETLATDDNEAVCETECHTLISNQQSLFQHLCPFLCHSAEEALKHLHSPNTDPTATGKRLVLDTFLNTQETSNIIDQLVATLSSDETEVQCEKECHVLIRDSTSVFQHMCPFLCHSAQAIVGNIHHKSTTTSVPPQKRVLLDTFLNTQETSNIIDQLVATLSSDETEVQCEKECHVLIRDSTSVFQHMCPFLCHSAQAIVGNIHHKSTTTSVPVAQKRLVFDSFLNSQEATKVIDQLVETLATDDNEAVCETECHTLISNQQSLFQHLCPFLCHSAEEALKHLHSPNTDPTATGKRLVIGNFLNTAETAKIIDQLVATLSSDESEVLCESECHTLIKDSTSVFQHMCPFLCHSAQAIIGGTHHTTTVPPVQKRFLLDTLLHNPEVSDLVSSLVSVLGSDPTEKACENECVVMMHADSVMHHLCPFICTSFQQLVSKVHLDQPAANPSKRFLVDSLLNNPEVSLIVDSLVGTLGSDPTEAACESQCTVVVHADNVFHYLCPLICTSFQSLVQKIPHHQQVAANPGL